MGSVMATCAAAAAAADIAAEIVTAAAAAVYWRTSCFAGSLSYTDDPKLRNDYGITCLWFFCPHMQRIGLFVVYGSRAW